MTPRVLWAILKDFVTVVVLISWVVIPAAFFFYHEDFDNWEGSLFPVATGTAIIDARPVGDGHKKIQVKLEFNKVRACDPEAVILVELLNDNGIIDVVPARFINDTDGVLISRPIGWNITRWWEIDTSWVKGHTATFRIIAIHNCHPGWKTRTIMYEGNIATTTPPRYIANF